MPISIMVIKRATRRKKRMANGSARGKKCGLEGRIANSLPTHHDHSIKTGTVPCFTLLCFLRFCKPRSKRQRRGGRDVPEEDTRRDGAYACKLLEPDRKST